MLLKHTACHPGKKVKVVLRDGRIMYGRFKDRRNKFIFLVMEDGHIERIDKESIKVFSIFNQFIANLDHNAIQRNKNKRNS